MIEYVIKKRWFKGITGLVLLINSVVLFLSLVVIFMNAIAIKAVHQEVIDLKAKVEEEIKLREELFTTLRKSAGLLRKYNPRLDEITAFKYACKIYESSEHPVTPELLTALIVVESGADHIAISNRGAVGLTQVLPHVWSYQVEELCNPYRNIEIGAKILKYYIERHGIRGGLSFYKSGSKNKSLDYATGVLKVAEEL